MHPSVAILSLTLVLSFSQSFQFQCSVSTEARPYFPARPIYILASLCIGEEWLKSSQLVIRWANVGQCSIMYVDMSDQYSVIEQFLFITRFSLRAPAVVYRALALSTPASASYTPHTTVGALHVCLEWLL